MGTPTRIFIEIYVKRLFCDILGIFLLLWGSFTMLFLILCDFRSRWLTRTPVKSVMSHSGLIIKTISSLGTGIVVFYHSEVDFKTSFILDAIYSSTIMVALDGSRKVPKIIF